MKGMRGVVEEREALRRQLRADPDTVRRRRITRIIAAVQLPVAIILMKMSLQFHFSLGTGASITKTSVPDASPATFSGVFLAATGLSLLGVSFVLFVRSPFRMPIGERLFRVIWLGPIGRTFVRLSARKVRRTQSAGSGSMASVAARALAVTPAPRTSRIRSPNGTADPFKRLEARIAALEEWKASKE
jgi:hypothetical protein